MSWVVLAGALAAFGLFACGDDEPPSADYTVVIQEFRFFENSIVVPAGSTVRWVNLNPRDSVRTVTSGSGPADTAAGAVFDQTLRGYESGKVEGEDFIYQFDDRGSYAYFSKLPRGSEFTGLVVVQ
jgi:plastocyanin